MVYRGWVVGDREGVVVWIVDVTDEEVEAEEEEGLPWFGRLPNRRTLLSEFGRLRGCDLGRRLRNCLFRIERSVEDEGGRRRGQLFCHQA